MEEFYKQLKPVLDVDAGLKQLMNRKKLYCKLIKSFNLSSIAADLTLCYAHKDFTKLAKKASALEAVAEDLGFTELHETSQMLERYARKMICEDNEIVMFNEAVARAIKCANQFLDMEHVPNYRI